MEKLLTGVWFLFFYAVLAVFLLAGMLKMAAVYVQDAATAYLQDVLT